jgi:phytoene dehydrogenase-like protein
MHWLTGSDKKEPINKLWRHVGALNDSVNIHYPEPFFEIALEKTSIRIYRNIDTTEQHLLELSPADAKEIKKLCGYIRKVKNLTMPVTDLRSVKVTKKTQVPLSLLFSALSAFRVMAALSKISLNKYINKFTHEGICDMIRAFTSEKNGVLPFIFTMGTLARGDGGFPEGGSLPFTNRIVKTFTALGGEILYNTRADKVIIENIANSKRITGVLAGGKKMPADAVIITADTMAIDHLFDTPPKTQWLDEMQKTTEPTMVTLVSLGINADLKKYQKNYVFKPKKLLKLDNEVYDFISLNNYADDPVYSPQGKTAMTVQLSGDTYDFWKKAKEENRYNEEKKKIAEAVVEAVSAQMPEANGKVEIIDVATPLTYERYCGNWKGSWMTEMKPGMKMKSYPAIINGLNGLYFAGHRMMPPGGLPVALMSARIAVQHLCRDTGTLFISEE